MFSMPYLSPNYQAGVGAHPTGKRCFLNTVVKISVLCRAGQQTAGVQEFPLGQSRYSLCLQGGKQNHGSTILQFPCSSAVTPVTKFCTSLGTTHSCLALFLFCLISEIPHLPSLLRWPCKIVPTSSKYCQLHPNQGNPSAP